MATSVKKCEYYGSNKTNITTDEAGKNTKNGTAIPTKRDGYARSATEIISTLKPIL